LTNQHEGVLFKAKLTDLKQQIHGTVSAISEPVCFHKSVNFSVLFTSPIQLWEIKTLNSYKLTEESWQLDGYVCVTNSNFA